MNKGDRYRLPSGQVAIVVGVKFVRWWMPWRKQDTAIVLVGPFTPWGAALGMRGPISEVADTLMELGAVKLPG